MSASIYSQNLSFHDDLHVIKGYSLTHIRPISGGHYFEVRAISNWRFGFRPFQIHDDDWAFVKANHSVIRKCMFWEIADNHWSELRKILICQLCAELNRDYRSFSLAGSFQWKPQTSGTLSCWTPQNTPIPVTRAGRPSQLSQTAKPDGVIFTSSFRIERYLT